MYIQCSRCHEPTWIRSLVPGLVDPTVKCQDCGHEHDLCRADELGETGKEQYALASEFSTRNGVDLPTAYSVLLGLITLQEARDAATAQKEKLRKKAPKTDTPIEIADSPAVEMDSAIEIEDSLAAETDMAIEVMDSPTVETDTPVLLLDTDGAEADTAAPTTGTGPAPRRRYSNAARHRRPRRREQKVTIHVERESAKERRKFTWSQIVLVSVLASLTLGLSGRHAYVTWRGLVEEGKTAQRNTAASADAVRSGEEKALAVARKKQSDGPEALKATVHRDHEDRVTQVVGPNPMTVLTAYCEAASDTYEREPLELAQAVPPTANERFGIFRDFSRLETNRAIRISQDHETQRWVAGDGQTPIPTRDAPAEPDTIRRAALTDGR
jgi:hypothetical protein